MTKERLQKLIDALTSKREGLLEKYVQKLEAYSITEAGAQPQGMEAIDFSGLINDLDRHVTNLNLEIKAKKVVANA